MLTLREYQDRLPSRIVGRITEMPGPMPSPCFVWTGALSNGYANAKWQGRARKLHRVLYDELVGPITEGLVLDHLCRNRACLNVAHLEQVTQRENILRGEGPAAIEATRTHCPAGHPYDEANTIRIPSRPNARYCRACQRVHQRNYRARKAAA